MENTGGAWLRFCARSTTASLGGERHRLEASSLKSLVSQFSLLETTTRPELAGCSGIGMKLNPNLPDQNPACCEGSCARACWGLPDYDGMGEDTAPPEKTPAASTCCQPRGKSSACCLKTKGSWGGGGGGEWCQFKEPGLPSPLCLSHGPAQVPGRCEAPWSHRGVKAEVCLTVSLANGRLRGSLSNPSWKGGGG